MLKGEPLCTIAGKITNMGDSMVVPLVAQTVKNLPAMLDTQVQSLGREHPLEEVRLPIPISCLENYMDRGAWWAIVHGISKNWT